MNSNEISIETVFPLGINNGLRLFVLPRDLIKAFYIPRASVKIFEKKYTQCTNLCGVYILFKRLDDGSLGSPYIGSTSNIIQRMKSHSNKDKENWWDIEVVFFIDDTNNELRENDVYYLENMMYHKAKKCGTILKYNSSEPHKGSASSYRKQDLYHFFKCIKALTLSMGFTTFFNRKNIVTHNNVSDYKTYYANDNKAKAIYTPKGMLVLKGSQVKLDKHPNGSDSFGKTNKKKLKSLKKNKIIDIHTGKFTRDFLFATPSAASNIIYTRKSDGLLKWKTKDGKTLKDDNPSNV